MGMSFASSSPPVAQAQAQQPILQIRRPFLPKPPTVIAHKHFPVAAPSNVATTSRALVYCQLSSGDADNDNKYTLEEPDKCPPSISNTSSWTYPTAATGRRTVLVQQLVYWGFTSMCTSMTAVADTQEGTKYYRRCVDGGGGDRRRITDKVYFDISIDREAVGRIVIGLYGEDAVVGAKRFAELAKGKKGVSYRKKEFMKITPSYIQNAGLRSFALGGSDSSATFEGGDNAQRLIPELEAAKQRCPNSTQNVAGSVSLVVKDASKPPPKAKLVARDGKLQVLEEEARPDPNGTEFSIAIRDSPELDESNLVVGRVIDGFNVLSAISAVKVVQDNTSSPYFKVAKIVGDTRAVVAERGFYRPYSKVVITRCGVLDS